MENSTNQVAVKTGEWVLTFLITSIPVIGFIMLFVWAFGSGTNESKANFAKAALIWFAIIMGIYILFALVFGAALLSAFS
jgi:succinate dehydrogenase/fumarate reductase cytochrome b subunit